MTRRALLTSLLVACLTPAASCGGEDGAAANNPYAGYVSATYAGTDHWLCHPDLTGSANVCNGDQTTIRVAADGSSTTEAFVPAADPPVDCFYLYPTVSFDLAANADLDPGAQETGTTLIQAARYGSVCAGAAPGSEALTTTKGSSMSGKSCTTLPRKASSPASVSNANSSTAGTGLRMEYAEKFMSLSLLGGR